MSNIDELNMLCKRLSALLDDPHPGLFTWRGAVVEARLALLEFHGCTCSSRGGRND